MSYILSGNATGKRVVTETDTISALSCSFIAILASEAQRLDPHLAVSWWENLGNRVNTSFEVHHLSGSI